MCRGVVFDLNTSLMVGATLTNRNKKKTFIHVHYVIIIVAECGGLITEPGMISPPSTSSGKYYGRLNCTWVIRAPEGKSVVLRIEKFDLEFSHK